MKIEKLKQGMEFKNYKVLCEFLEVKPTTGKSRQLFMEELGRYVEFHKVGNKIIIDEVLKVVVEKVDKRKDPNKKSNNAKYSDDIQALIISLLASAEDKEVNLPINRLLRLLEMVNCNYSDARRSIPRLSEITSVPEEFCYQFFNDNGTNLKKKLATALRGLRNRALIMAEESVFVCVLAQTVEINNFGDLKVNPINKKQTATTYRRIHREATREEKQLILKTEELVLEEFKSSTIQYVFATGRFQEFQKRVNSILLEKANIEYYYDSYKITCNKDSIQRVLIKQLEQEERDKIANNLNANISKMIDSYAKTTHNRATKKEKLNAIDVIHSDDNYVNHMNTLTGVVIDKSAKDIRKELKKPVKKKEYEQLTLEDMPF